MSWDPSHSSAMSTVLGVTAAPRLLTSGKGAGFHTQAVSVFQQHHTDPSPRQEAQTLVKSVLCGF